jgi:hypothetical protein
VPHTPRQFLKCFMWVGKTKFVEPVANDIIEAMRKKLVSTGVGVTIQGSLVTLRWYENDRLVQVTMAVSDVDDGTVEFED